MNALRIAMLAAVLIIGGCSFFQPQNEGPETQEVEASSQEWRLMSLEKSFLDFKEQAREQQSAYARRDQELERKLEDFGRRIEALQAEVADLEALQAPTVTVEERMLAPGETEADVVIGGSVSPEDRPWADVPGPAQQEPEPKAKAEAPKPAPKAKAKAEAPKPAPKPQPKPEPSRAPAEKAQYDKALALLQNGKPEQARTAFNAFLSANADSPLAPNALYWLGETYYDQEDYPQAILSFKDVPRRFPKHDKSAAALYKIALCYEQLGDKSNAEFYLRALLDDYPDSQPAGMAKARLASLAG